MSVDHVGYILGLVDSVTDKIPHCSPVEHAERERYLPASVTPHPGPYRFKLNPFMREIVDCFDVRCDVREVSVMKGVQITYSTIAENVLFYMASHVKTAPCQWLANDDKSAQKRLSKNILPMLQQSGWEHILQSNDTLDSRKKGATIDQMSWLGGGYVLFSGVQTGGKLRQDSIMCQVKDELDAWPQHVGNDGCPDEVSDDRCAAFWEDRKILRGSTPLLMGSSKIYRRYLAGDRRHYYVNCLGCEKEQYLRWYHVDKDTGVIGGIGWALGDERQLLVESVHYACIYCGHKHYEYDKPRLFSPENGAKWKPTAIPSEPCIRSYKLPALYSPMGMQPWYKCVATWLKGWDVENKKVRDVGTLQKFYNNVLAEPFEMLGDKLELATVSRHRRRAYDMGQIPNKWAVKYCQSTVGMVIITVDVQKDWLSIGIWGFTKGNRTILIDYHEPQGDTESSDKGPWLFLQDLIEKKIWVADDGSTYRAVLTLVDAGFRTDTVYKFCSAYDSVHAVIGRAQPAKGAAIQEFSQYESKLGTRAFKLVVDLYKDRMNIQLKRDWDGQGYLPDGALSVPFDLPDRVVKHLTVEYKQVKKNPRTGQPMGWEWYRPGNVRQELWDLLVYAVAGLEIMAWDLMMVQQECEYVEWGAFWDIVLNEKLYYNDGSINPIDVDSND